MKRALKTGSILVLVGVGIGALLMQFLPNFAFGPGGGGGKSGSGDAIFSRDTEKVDKDALPAQDRTRADNVSSTSTQPPAPSARRTTPDPRSVQGDVVHVLV